jgi:hypothetical protein
MELTMGNLEECFMKAHKEGAKFAGIIVEMDDFPEKELIINKHENIMSKLNYYRNTYDENLHHKYSKSIRIFGIVYGDSLAEFEQIVF